MKQLKKKIQSSGSEKGKEDKKDDIPERPTTEQGQSTETTDSITNLQSQDNLRERHTQAGASLPSVTPPDRAQTVRNSGKGAGSLVLISLLLMVILALALRRLFML